MAAARIDAHISFLNTAGATLASNAIPAGTQGTWRLRITVAEGTLSGADRIIVDRYNLQLAHAPHTEADGGRRRDWVTVSGPDHAQVHVELPSRDKQLLVVVDSGELRAGDTVELLFGDRSNGAAGSEAFWSATRGRLHVQVMRGGETVSSVHLPIDIVAHPRLDRLRLLGPSTARPGEQVALHLIAFDRNRNVITDFASTVTFRPLTGIEQLPARVAFTPDHLGVLVVQARVSAAGVYRIECHTAEGTTACSNPIVCDPQLTRQLLWGDLHNHAWGDISMLLMHDRTWKLDPAARHDQARRVGRYDYAAPGAMAMPDGPEREEIWQAYRDGVASHDHPGQYVPFLAMEMHPEPHGSGDRNLILKGDVASPPMRMRSPVQDVYAAYSGMQDAILETHIGGQPPNWKIYQPAQEQMIEVSSGFGNAEWLLQWGLQLGFRPALTAASDLHLGLLGAPRAVETFRGRFGYSDRRLRVRDSGFGSGPVGAVWASEKTRDQLWQGMSERNGYGTSGTRMFLDLRVGGQAMGEIVASPGPLRVQLRVHAEAPVERIDLIAGGHVAWSDRPGTLDVNVDLTLTPQETPRAPWLYFRVRQVDGEFGWTAPVWLTDPAWTAPGKNTWPAWNATPLPQSDDSARQHLADLESYLSVEGDRGSFGELVPLDIRSESNGQVARFASRTSAEDHPVLIRWFYEFEIPKLRVDWGYDTFGVVNCHTGPQPER